MNRFTERFPNGHIDYSDYGFTHEGRNGDSVLQRLADYEDTGYTPEQIKKMAKKISTLEEEIADYEWREELRYEFELGDDI